MKLTVGRIVHAHYVNHRNGGVQESGPWAALVTHVLPTYARLRIFWASPEYDQTAEVSLIEGAHHGEYNVIWRWPPKEG